MNAYSLPTSLTVGGVEYEIRSDFRAVLDVLSAMSDDELDERARTLVLLAVIYPGWESIPPEHLAEAVDAACEFIDGGQRRRGQAEPTAKLPRLYDWEADAALIIPAVNGVAHTEVRALPYLHWWTFLGYFMEIGDSLFSTVLGIRKKRAAKKKLEPWESETVRAHREWFAPPKREGDRREREAIEAWL